MPQIELIFQPPDECRDCGFTVPRKNNPDQAVSVENQWQFVALPGSPIWLYFCPKCGCVHPNKNFVENNKALMAVREQRIITGGGPKVVGMRN